MSKETEKLPRSRFQKRHTPQVGPSSDPEDKISSNYSCWCPRPSVFFNFILSARITSSFFSNISDCDETYNYWEPTHYLLYGTGFQTWEYSPDYALRSYGYLSLHSVLAKVMKDVLKANKITVFYYLRFFLSVICAACETYFYKSIMLQFDNHVARLFLAFSALNTGLFIASCAYLPSSFTMYACMIAYGGWFRGNYPVAIFGIAVGALIGWPFFGVLGVPIAFDIIVRHRRFKLFMLWSFCALIAIMGPLVAIDTHYYGKTVIAPLNIVLYNVFGKGGPDLYGVEPWSFYFVNGFLNFNVMFFIALLSLPMLILLNMFQTKNRQFQHHLKVPDWLALSGLYIWVAIFFTRPHKEERFLFPIYPLILFNGSLILSKFQELYNYIFPSKVKDHHYSDSSNWIVGIIVVLFSALSVSRSISLYTGYHAPLDVYPQLHELVNPLDESALPVYKPGEKVNVCVGREWYRYPSSFFLPDNWNYLFVKSDFSGQLPQHYQRRADATKVSPPNMNDMNLEEKSAHFPLSQCDLMIDINMVSGSGHEPNYSADVGNWEVVHSVQFMDNSKSHRLFRAFYVPFLSTKYTSYVEYNLLKKKNKKKVNKKRRTR